MNFFHSDEEAAKLIDADVGMKRKKKWNETSTGSILDLCQWAPQLAIDSQFFSYDFVVFFDIFSSDIQSLQLLDESSNMDDDDPFTEKLMSFEVRAIVLHEWKSLSSLLYVCVDFPSIKLSKNNFWLLPISKGAPNLSPSQLAVQSFNLWIVLKYLLRNGLNHWNAITINRSCQKLP